MRFLRLLCALVLSGLSCLIVFFGVSINAHALSGGRFLTPSETRSIFGDSIPAKYFTGTDYADITFNYIGTSSLSTCDWTDNSGYFVQGRDVICYYVNNVRNVNSNANYITVDCTPEYSLFDFDQLYTNIGVSNAQTQNIQAYQSPFWKWFIADSEITFEGSSAIPVTGEFPHSVLANGNRSYIFCPVEYHNQSLVSGYSLRAGFYGASHYNGAMYLYIACPYITDGATGMTGTFTITSNVNQGDINVNVDLSETNTLLGGIADLIGGLVDGIADLFIPEQNTITAFENALADLLLDTFGGIESDMLDDVIQDLLTHGATESITWPAISVPGTNFSLPSYNVPLKPHAVQGRALYEAVALAIDLMATSYVINLIMHNIKVFLVGEKVVEIEDAD